DGARGSTTGRFGNRGAATATVRLTHAQHYLLVQVIFGEEREPLARQRVDRGLVVVDVQGEGGLALGAEQERVGVIDVDLRDQKGLANVQQRVGAFRQLDDEQVTLGDGEVGEPEDLQ